MAEQNIHINYSAEDIERYVKGKMSAKEMHDMEKAALQDPFLAEAIEGYGNASFEKTHNHLNEITAALQTQKEETKVVPLAVKNFYWWRVAAIIILVVGVGAISWFMINSNNGMTEAKDLAKAKENKSLNTDTLQQRESTNVIAKNDTLKELLAQNLSSKVAKREKQKNDLQKEERLETEELKKSESASQAFEKAIRADTLAIENNTVSISSLKEIRFDTLQFRKQASPAFAQSSFSNNALNTFSGRVVDNNNQPVPYATISANNKMIITDSNGNFKLQAPDSLLLANISSVGYVSANAQLKSSAANNISIQPDRVTLDEVGTTGFGKRKEAKRISSDSAYPAGGWESFQAYVYKKLNKPFDTTRAPEITG